MNAIFKLIIVIFMITGGSHLGLKAAHDFMRDLTFKTISQGLPPLSSMTPNFQEYEQ